MNDSKPGGRNDAERPAAAHGEHKIHGVIILCVTLLFYIVFFSYFDSSDGGGQPTLPGMGRVVAMFLIVLAVIVTIYQLLVFRTIRKSSRMSVANLMLALPLVAMIGISISLLELPDRYSKSVFYSLIASILIQFFALRRKSYVFAGIGYTIMGVALILCLDWTGRSARNPRWWEQGRVVRYYENGMKKEEIEHVEEGAWSGDYIQWNEDGTPLAFDRFPAGTSKPADSTVRYHRGGAVESISHTFDSGGIGYKRRSGYTESGRLRNFDQQTTSLDTQFQRSETYDRVTGEIRYLDYNFDSAGERYRRTLTYDDQGLRTIHLEGWRKGTRYTKKFPRHR